MFLNGLDRTTGGEGGAVILVPQEIAFDLDDGADEIAFDLDDTSAVLDMTIEASG